MGPDHGGEVAHQVMRALAELWSATDHPEAYELANYSLDDMRRMAAEWEQVRKACDRLYRTMREAHPDLIGDFPIGGDRPLEGLQDD